MTNIEFLPYPEISSESGATDKLVVFLHGLGSDGHDLISLAPFFEKNLKNTHFISPHGVEECDMVPFGRQWFSLQDRTLDTVIKLASDNAKHIEKLIKEKQQQLGLSNEQTIIIGFSQGTMIGVYLTLIQDTPYAATIGFSGRLIPPAEIKNKSTPICLVHGLEDQLVPASETKEMAEFLSKNGIENDKLIVPNLTHSIDASGIKFATNFLNKYLS